MNDKRWQMTYDIRRRQTAHLGAVPLNAELRDRYHRRHVETQEGQEGDDTGHSGVPRVIKSHVPRCWQLVHPADPADRGEMQINGMTKENVSDPADSQCGALVRCST